MNLSKKLLHASMHHKIKLCDDMMLHNCQIIQRSTKHVILQSLTEDLLDSFINDFADAKEVNSLCNYFDSEITQPHHIIINAEIIN